MTESFQTRLRTLEKSGLISKEIRAILSGFQESYQNAVSANQKDFLEHSPILEQFLEFVTEQYSNPHVFGSYHEKITQPVDFYHFGLDFLRPVVRLDESTVIGEEQVSEIEELLQKGENVVLFSNHQTEPDPQAISLLLEKSHQQLAQDMIFVAGHRVTTDPLAIPFSMGRNLLCIYSKNYIEHPPEKRHEKVLHNQRTMKVMRELLSEGGKCIYVAPSGGRDRPNAEGVVEVAPFDPQSIEMFWFTAKRSPRPTHFYPLALSTYRLLPPPQTINKKLGEKRETVSCPIHIAFGERIDMENFPGSEIPDKKEKRARRADAIWKTVKGLYNKISV